MAENNQNDKGQTGSIRTQAVQDEMMKQPRLKTRPDSIPQQGGTAGKQSSGKTAAGKAGGAQSGKETAGAGRDSRTNARRKKAVRGRGTAARKSPETEEERRERVKQYQQKKEQYLRKKMQKRIMRKVLIGLGVVGVFLVLTGVIALGRRIHLRNEQRAAEAAEAEEIARTQMQVGASEVLHLSFPVLTLDKIEEEKDDFIDEDGDGIPDDFIDEDGDGIPDDIIDEDGDGIPDDEGDGQEDTENESGQGGPVMLDTDGDGEPDTEAVIDTDGDGVPDAPEGALAYETPDTLTVQEFNQILNELYQQDYVLVDIYSLASEGEAGFEKNMISVPNGKKPLIISQRDVSYSTRLNGHVDRLIVDEGAIATEYINAENERIVGEQDVIPALESFIRQHPDFSFQGARGIVGVTGYRGLFGYQVVLDEAVITTPIPDKMASADKVLHGGDTKANLADTGEEDGEAAQEADTGEAAAGETGTGEDGEQSTETDTGEAAAGEDMTGNDGEESPETDAEEAAAGDDGGNETEAEQDGVQTEPESGTGTEDGAAGPEAADETEDGAAETDSEGEARRSAETGSAADPMRPYIGNDAVRSNLADVEEIVNILRGTGWRLASNGYSLLSYGSEFDMMKEDMDIWQEDIGAVLGTTDILLFPRKTDIGSWSVYQESDEKYAYLSKLGFKYFCIENNQERSWLQVQPGYVRQGIHEISNYHDFEEIMKMG